MMDNTGKIVGINLFVFLIYTLIIQAIIGQNDPFLGPMVICAHAAFLFIVGIFMAFSKEGKKRSQVGGFILSAFLISIIGFSVYLGILNFH